MRQEKERGKKGGYIYRERECACVCREREGKVRVTIERGERQKILVGGRKGQRGVGKKPEKRQLS